jgi:5-methylcytosine-specific restriction protein B
MRQYTDSPAFKEMYRELYGAPKIRGWKEIWSFANDIKKGDIVVANNGLKSIVGIGTVTGDYWHDSNREEYKHCVPVDWKITTGFPVPQSAHHVVADWFRGTVKKIDRQQYNQLLAEGTNGGEMVDDEGHTTTPPPVHVDGRYAEICKRTFLPEKFFVDCERLLESKKQVVLQGAPGTGKTFVAEQLAALWAGTSERV